MLTVEFSLDTGCNLACKYCYSNHNPQKMTTAVADKFEKTIEPILKFYNQQDYHISYFGGEPLLNWELIEYTLPKFRESPKCKSIVLISNGLLLTQERVDFLKAYGCGLSWSFDGIWSSKNRPLANSEKESLNEYLKVLGLTKQLTQSCKVMVNPYSFNTLLENFEFFIENGINHPDFCLVRDSIYTQKDIQNFKIQAKKLANKIIEYNQNGLQCSVGFFTLYVLDILASKLYGKRNHGCFVGSNGILYAVDGTIWPCERFRSTKKFCLFDGTNYNFENLKFLSENSNPKNFEKCQKCELFEYCNTGCFWSQLRNGKWVQQEPVDGVCELFKVCYSEGIKIYNNAGPNYQNYIHNCLNSGN